MDTLFNVLHVVSAVFIIGPMAILPMTAMRAARAGNGTQVQSLARATSTFTLLSLIVFVFGFAVLGMSDPKDHFSFASGWIIGSIVLYVLALGINLFVTVPAMKRVAAGVTEARGSDGAVASGRPAGYGAIAGGSGLASLLLVAVVVLMVWKP